MRKITKLIVFCMLIMMMFGMISDTYYCDTKKIIDVANNEAFTMEYDSDSVLLMEASTGKVLYEKDADKVVSPASITKIMTLILIFDNIYAQKISLEDVVTTSEYAKSMGGSQVFLETGEQQTVETLIKCIVVASGNDASVCMAEYIAGSEEAFVEMMNERAKSLNMTNTVFKDCCGLNDTMEHHTSARDVAIMSRELITKYPEIYEYTKIWMENIVHKTNKGEKEFTLANTNKLIKQYEWATGLKTGSTSLAKYCLSATAKKNNVELIAVIMGAPDYKVRFSEALKLLEYGFLNISMYTDSNTDLKKSLKVRNGKKDIVNIDSKKEFNYICDINEKKEDIKRIVEYYKIYAPIKKDEVVGKIDYKIGEKVIGTLEITAKETVEKLSYMDYIKKIWYKYMV